MEDYVGLGRSLTPQVSFEEYSETNDAQKVNLLRSQLAIVDRAIGKIGSQSHEGDSIADGELPPSTFDTAQRATQRSGTQQATTDTSFKIDTMSSQLATCPQCLAEMDVKKLRSHVSSSCPNKIITCPELNCGCRLPLKQLRKHLALECEITMKRRRLVAEAEQRREQEALRMAEEAEERRTARLAESALMKATAHSDNAAPTVSRPTTATATGAGLTGALDLLDDLDSRHTICPQCSESMKQSQLSNHLLSKCTRRRIMCPNFHSGCKHGLVPLYLLQVHLSSECAAEKHRETMIARSVHRQEIVKCPACGELLPLMNLRKHEKELCANRRVHCRNHPLGCTVMVRLKERALHERVDGNKALRPALYLPSHGARLSIREDDIPCPWTAEYWIYRPPATESLKGHLRNIFLLLPKYNVAFAAEVCVHDQVMRLVRALKNSNVPTGAAAAEATARLTKEQRAQIARELAQQRMDLVNSLSALVPLYTETVLAYTRAFQELAVSVEAATECAEEITSAVGFRDTERVTLQVVHPGEVAAPPKNQFGTTHKKKDAEAVGGDKRTEGTGTKVGSKSGGTSKAVSSSNSSVISAASAQSNQSKQASVQSKQSAPGSVASSSAEHKGETSQDLQGADVDMEIVNMADMGFDDMDYLGAEGDEGEGEDGEGYVDEDGDGWGAEDDDVGEGEGVDQDQGGSALAGDKASAVSSATGKSSQASHSSVLGPRAKGGRPLNVNYDAIATYIKSGCTMSSLFKACLHLENPKVLYETERRYFAHLPLPGTSNEFVESLEQLEEAGGENHTPSSSGLLLHPDLDLQYLLPATPERAHHESSTASAASSAHPGVTKIPAESISRAVRELQMQGISEFLTDLLLAPQRAAKGRALSWCTWQSLLQLIRTALKTDFDALQVWRVEAGLLKPDASKGSGTGGKGGGKSELTAKQEKALEKKERARLKREMKKQEKQQAMHGGEEGDSPIASTPAASTAVKKDEGLFKRVGELLKSGCGAGVLAEGTCISKGEVASHSRICLSLDSGLSLLVSSNAQQDAQQRPLSRQSNGSGNGAGTGRGGGHDSDAENDEAGAAAEGDHEDHHYDLLLRPQDMSRLARSSGKIGIVTIPHTLGETTGMGDYQLQQLAQQEAAVTAGRAGSPSKRGAGIGSSKAAGAGVPNMTPLSPPGSPGSPGSAGSPGSKTHRKRAGGAGAADGGTAAAGAVKKAASMVRLGMESRSFEVAVPRGKWTHIALVATALPQNKLTLYMDGLLVKTLKDCAFPLPMNALGGCTQSFESFDGALLDVRYWGVQRSSVQIVDNMHKLLELEVDGIPKLEGNSLGLVAWWTFEDGGGKVSVTDVTGHRFKTLIERRQAAVSGPMSTKTGVGLPITAASTKAKADESRVGTAATGTSAGATRASSPAGKQRDPADSDKEGFFTQEEGARPGLPDDVRRMLPAPFLKLLPPHSGTPTGVTGTGGDSGLGASGALMTAAPSRGGTAPWEAWLSTMPKWSWLDAETLPVPKALNMPPSALTTKAKSGSKEPPQLPKSPGHSSSSPDKNTHPVPHALADRKEQGKDDQSATGRGMLPVPSLRARGVCPYELRRHRLATSGRELQREVDCPLGCDQKVKMVDVRFHVRYVCNKRLVTCRFDYCSAVFPLFQREAHEHSECKHFYARERVLSLAELHTTMFPCSLCSESVMQRDMAAHEQHECPHRLVPCKYADCTMGSEPSMEAHLLRYHLRFQCDSPTRKERFMLVERARARLKYPRPWGIDVPLLEDAPPSTVGGGEQNATSTTEIA